MYIFRYILYEFQYSKYVRCLPFFIVRQNGIKEFYTPLSIDQIIKEYAFNRRFSPIGYALLCNSEVFEMASEPYDPHPAREYIRQRIAKMYFEDNTEFDICDLMRMSLYKFDWSVCDESAPSVNEEYWSYMGKCEEFERKRHDL